jgi:hypothetical protein
MLSPKENRMPAKTRVIKCPIPATRDPFINTPLIRLFPDPKTGAERFWISSYNATAGTTAVLIDEYGKSEIHRFTPPYAGFYSAVAVDADTLWLCGDLAKVVRYTLSTRKIEPFETGASSALVFNGMIYDKPTRKLMALAYPGTATAHAFVFDTRTLKPTFAGATNVKGLYMRCSHPAGDGTWASVAHLPSNEMVFWNPKTDRFGGCELTESIETESLGVTTYFLLRDKIKGVEGDCLYVPRYGWFDPRKRKYVKQGPRPERESTWLGRWKGYAVGAGNFERCVSLVSLWDMKTGKVRDVCTIPDAPLQNVNFTRSGAAVCVNMYGQFSRHDLLTGELLSSRDLDVKAVGSIDCLIRAGKDRVVGTPFITQRFWEADLRTKKGADMGRAASGSGEVMQVCDVGGKIYMAIYVGGDLMEYDPAKPARHPENPRVVAAPKDTLRPVSILNVGSRIFYSSTALYGQLGCVLTRYDTKTGVAAYAHDPLPTLAIRTLLHHTSAKLLIAGTGIHADCGSAPAKAKSAVLATIDPESLRAVKSVSMPDSLETVSVACALGGGHFACVTNPHVGKPGAIFEVSIRNLAIPPQTKWRDMPVRGSMRPTRSPGVVVINTNDGLQLWDLRTLKMIRQLAGKESANRHFFVQGDDILFNDPTTVYVLEDALKGV